MNINKLLSTEERVKILKDILYKENMLRVSEVSNRLGLSKGLVSKFFDILTEEGILKKEGMKFRILENKDLIALKILLNLNSFDLRIFKMFEFIKGAGFYGSFVKGLNTEESDTDLYVLIEDTSDENLAKITRKLKEKDRRINPLYLTEEKIKVLKEEDKVFYYSLIFGSINIYGKEIEELRI